MKHFSKLLCVLFSVVFSLSVVFGLSACNNTQEIVDSEKEMVQQLAALQNKIDALDKKISDMEKEEPEPAIAFDYGEECYEKIQYIDKVLSDRDCYKGANTKLAEKWILWNLYEAGYTTEEAFNSQFTLTNYYKEADLKTSLSAVASYELADELHYKKSGRKYVADESGEYVSVNVTLNNIVAIKKGISDEQIIIGAHFDGDGTGDNGSGIALGLTTAQHFYGVETYYTLVFVFFNAEEVGCKGSTAYANAMTEEEIAKTKEPDLTAADLDAAVRIIAGSARSMGIETEGV